MRIIVAAALLGTALVSLPALQAQDRPSGSLERAFVANGRVNLDLSAGEYRITASPDNRVRLRWSVEEPDQLARVRTYVDIRKNEASLSIDGNARNNDFRVDVQLPARSDLYVRLTAGELRIEGIEGNKDVESHAGEIHIDVGDAKAYRHVDGSVWAGEVHAEPFKMAKEGLFRSITWDGTGAYRLHTHLKAGEIHLYSKFTN